MKLAIIGNCGYWLYTSGRSLRLYTDGCVVDSGMGLMGLCIITKSISPWASPVVILPKKSAPGEPPQRRMCVDFRRLNKQLPGVKNMSGGKGCISLVPLPKIDELYAKLQGYKVFSTLDLCSGYYHIGLSDSAKPKTAFVVSGMGKFQFN